MSRVFSFIAVLIVAAAGMYIYMQQTKAVSPGGVEGNTANPRATIDLAGVKNDLLQFARAEQQHMATDGKYMSLDEMRSSGDTGLPGDSRGPFSYSIEAGATAFTVTATYNGPATDGVPKALHVGPEMRIATE
ncbi:MAG TPA: hypothetical protein VFU86_23395 [Terriglobales bacterium]|nr:hypothetical protein [Terriglobales bacterium]